MDLAAALSDHDPILLGMKLEIARLCRDSQYPLTQQDHFVKAVYHSINYKIDFIPFSKILSTFP